MKSFFKRKYKRLIALIAFLAVGCVGLFLGFAYFNANYSGDTLSFEKDGKTENLSAVSNTYDGEGYFLTSSLNVDGGLQRRYFAKKIGANGQVLFETELIRAEGDNGEFSFVTGVTEDRVIAFTSNFYYLYALKEDGLERLDFAQGHWNIGANPEGGIKNFAFDVYGDTIDIYSVHNSAGSATSIVVYAERTTIENDRFTTSIQSEIKRSSGSSNKRLVSMGASAKGVTVTEE